MENTDKTHAVVFPGQGSQFVGMADPWIDHPASRAVLDEASTALGTDVVEGCRDESLLGTTAFVQPAMLAIGVAAYRVLEAEGVQALGVAGHSLGEITALVAAGVLSLADALDLVIVRGRAMQEAAEQRPGTMAALLGVDADRAATLCDDAREDDVLVVANENSPTQTVISGSIPAVERAETIGRDQGIRAIRPNVAGAFHSPLMEPAVGPIVERLSSIAFHDPAFPIAENVTGQIEDDPHRLRELLGRHVVSPVRWASCVRALAEVGAGTLVESAPGDVLTKLARRIVPQSRAVAFASPQVVRDILRP